MTALRRRMLEDMQVRNLSAGTQQVYLQHISRGGAGAYQKGEKTFRPGIKGLGDGNGITPTVFTMFFHKNDYWDSHRRTRNSPAHGIA